MPRNFQITTKELYLNERDSLFAVRKKIMMKNLIWDSEGKLLNRKWGRYSEIYFEPLFKMGRLS